MDLSERSACDDIRHELCRLAVGPPAATVDALARHARRCADCRDFADDLAAVRAWLDGLAAAAVSACPTPDGRARNALSRELAARLARDLLALGQGRPDREAGLRRRDFRRLLALCGPSALRRPPWRGALRLLSGRRLAIDRRGALRLARQLDPVGLDVALAHLAQLERDGRRAAADAEAERVLALLT